MTTKVLRKIVRINEGRCDGCGACVPACAEGAIQVIDGKARLVSERYCDGLGACLGECPRGAITIEERLSEAFDEQAVGRHLEARRAETPLPGGCPSANVSRFERVDEAALATSPPAASMLRHWPVQLALVPPGAPFLRGADLLLAADCVPFAYAGFHHDILAGHALLVACPKLDDFSSHLAKLTDVLHQSDIRSLTVVHMEVPCCFGLVHMARRAMATSNKKTPFRAITIGVKGDIVAQEPESAIA